MSESYSPYQPQAPYQPFPQSTQPQSYSSVPSQPVYQPSSTLPPLPAVEQPVIQNQQKPKKKLLSMVNFLLLSLLVLVLVGGVTTGATYLTNNFVPGVSPLVEDIYHSPADQFTLRMNKVIELVTIGSAVTLQDAGYPVKTDFTAEEISLYRSTLGALSKDYHYKVTLNSDINTKAANDQNVLGATTAGGAANEAFFRALSTSPWITIAANAEGNSNTTDSKNPKASVQGQVVVTAGTERASIKAESRTLDSAAYIKVIHYPENPYFDLTTILNTWVKITFPKPTESNTIGMTNTKPTIIDKKIATDAKAYLRLPTVKKNIKLASADIINNVAAKCYSLTLSETDQKQLIKESFELGKTQGRISAYAKEPVLDTYVGETVITICFPNGSFVPGKITVENKESDKLIKKSMLISEWYASTKEQDISVPNDNIIRFEDVDLTKIVTRIPETPASRDIQRRSLTSVINNALLSYYADYAQYPGSQPTSPDLGCSGIGTFARSFTYTRCTKAISPTGGLLFTRGPNGIADYYERTVNWGPIDLLANPPLIAYYAGTAGGTNTRALKYGICIVLEDPNGGNVVRPFAAGRSAGKKDCFCLGSDYAPYACVGLGSY
jgi:hypothetical protein